MLSFFAVKSGLVTGLPFDSSNKFLVVLFVNQGHFVELTRHFLIFSKQNFVFFVTEKNSGNRCTSIVGQFCFLIRWLSIAGWIAN